MNGGQSRKSTGKVVTLGQVARHNNKIDLLSQIFETGGISCAYYADMPAEQLLQAVDDMRPDLRLRETKHLGNGFLDVSVGNYCLCMLVQSLEADRSAVVISLADALSPNPNLSNNDIRTLNTVMQTLRPVCEEPERGASGTSYPKITKTMFPSLKVGGTQLPQDLATILEHGTAVSPWDVPGFEHTRAADVDEDGVYPAAFYRAVRGWNPENGNIFTRLVGNQFFLVGPCCWSATYGKQIPKNELVICLQLMNPTDAQLKPYIAIAQNGGYSLSHFSSDSWFLYSPIPRNVTKDELNRKCQALASL